MQPTSQNSSIAAKTVLAQRLKKERLLKQIPGQQGLPLIGQTLELMRDPLTFLRKRYDMDGEIFWSALFGTHMTHLLGPDSNQFVLQNREHQFSNAGGWNYFIGKFFTRGIMLLDFEEHRWHRQIMQAAFTKKALSSYLDIMNPGITKGIARWQADDHFKILAHVKALTLDLATEVFMGEALGPEAKVINTAFVETVRAGSAVIRYPLPGSLWSRGLKSRALLERFFSARIAAKRATPGQDLFSQLCLAEGDDGQRFSDEDVTNHMIFLLMAAHDTTTITLCSLLYQLAKNPLWQDKARAESLALCSHDLVFTSLDQLPTLSLCMKEALRLLPPVPGMPRMTTQDIEFKGYLIPKKTLINIHPLFSHHMPECWTHPERFDPERFSEPRMEHKQHPYQYVPFGGGAHMCIGLHFAEMQVKAVAHHLLQRFRWDVKPGYTMPVDFRSLPVPFDGLPVRLVAL